MENTGMIYGLIAKGISLIGAIGKGKKNTQQNYAYRGIDDIYNALNPVLAELGIFFCPEILEHRREQRETKNGTVLFYTILKVRYTAYAPDGSSVTLTVIGEGMDSGDKSSNKAMSVAMKYAMFQLFAIPTEESKEKFRLVDPDEDSHTDIKPINAQAQAPATATATATAQEKADDVDPVRKYLTEATAQLRVIRGLSASDNSKLFAAQWTELKKAGSVPDKKLGDYNIDEAKMLIALMHKMDGDNGNEVHENEEPA